MKKVKRNSLPVILHVKSERKTFVDIASQFNGKEQPSNVILTGIDESFAGRHCRNVQTNKNNIETGQWRIINLN